jgi:hypothetical protein
MESLIDPVCFFRPALIMAVAGTQDNWISGKPEGMIRLVSCDITIISYSRTG